MNDVSTLKAMASQKPTVRLLRPADKPKFQAQLRDVSFTTSAMSQFGNLLHWYLPPSRSCSHVAFSRVLRTDDYFGHVSAHLISDEIGLALEQSQDEMLFQNPEFLRPLELNELRRNNNDDGSVLAITSLACQTGDEFGELYFLREAMRRLVRWFQGNLVSRVYFRHGPEAGDLEHLLVDFDARSVTRTKTMTGSWIVCIRPQLRLWRGMIDHWTEALFATDFDPDTPISDRLKIKARILYEFNFDLLSAIEACIPTWTVNVAGGRADCASFNKWRRAMADDLGINLGNDRRQNVMDQIRLRIEEEPRLLALY